MTQELTFRHPDYTGEPTVMTEEEFAEKDGNECPRCECELEYPTQNAIITWDCDTALIEAWCPECCTFVKVKFEITGFKQ